ncbi:MAG TPA: cupin domain-containing protein [Acidimicrobiia bacterium]
MRPYRVNRSAVPHVGGLRRQEGWVDMQVQFLVDEAGAGSRHLLVGWTVLPPGARHERHKHPNADEFFIVIAGSGVVYTDGDDEPAAEGDTIFTPRGHWHGFANTGTEDVVLAWGWSGAGSLEAAGYETPGGEGP